MSLQKFTLEELHNSACDDWQPSCGGSQHESLCHVFGDEKGITALDLLACDHLRAYEKLAACSSNECVISLDQRREVTDAIGSSVVSQYIEEGGAEPQALSNVLTVRDSMGLAPGHVAKLAPGPGGSKSHRKLACAAALLALPIDDEGSMYRVVMGAAGYSEDEAVKLLSSTLEQLYGVGA